MSDYLPAILKMQAVNHLLNRKLPFVHTGKDIDKRAASLGVERVARWHAGFQGELLAPHAGRTS
jgi:hypothetical protein